MKKINAKVESEKLIVKSIKNWYTKHDYGPSYRDLSEVTGLALGYLFEICQELREAGVLDFQDGVARTIKLKGEI